MILIFLSNIEFVKEFKYQNEPTFQFKINELRLQKNVNSCFYKKNNYQISFLLVLVFVKQINSMYI